MPKKIEYEVKTNGLSDAAAKKCLETLADIIAKREGVTINVIIRRKDTGEILEC